MPLKFTVAWLVAREKVLKTSRFCPFSPGCEMTLLDVCWAMANSPMVSLENALAAPMKSSVPPANSTTWVLLRRSVTFAAVMPRAAA